VPCRWHAVLLSPGRLASTARVSTIRTVRQTTLAHVSRTSGPRAWVKTPLLFGKWEGIQWKPATKDDEAEVRAAILQHHIVMQIRRVMHEKGITTDAQLAQRIGLSAAQVGRLMRGQSAMTLRTITIIEVALESTLLRPVQPQTTKTTRA
jgi:DNA-binding Xre family transcriptional regulator